MLEAFSYQRSEIHEILISTFRRTIKRKEILTPIQHGNIMPVLWKWQLWQLLCWEQVVARPTITWKKQLLRT